jgi:hypothetical protein
MSSRDHVLSADTELWHAGWMLAAIVALVATEWTLRKRYGLM